MSEEFRKKLRSGFNTIKFFIHQSPIEAPDYNAQEETWNAAVLDTVRIIKDGTTCGHSTVDFNFIDEHGKKFVAMVTLANMKTIMNAVEK